MRRHYSSYKTIETEAEVEVTIHDLISELEHVNISCLLELRDRLPDIIKDRQISLNGREDHRGDELSFETYVDVEISRDDVEDMFHDEDSAYEYIDENGLIVIDGPSHLTARLELEDDLRALNEKFKTKYSIGILTQSNIKE